MQWVQPSLIVDLISWSHRHITSSPSNSINSPPSCFLISVYTMMLLLQSMSQLAKLNLLLKIICYECDLFILKAFLVLRHQSLNLKCIHNRSTYELHYKQCHISNIKKQYCEHFVNKNYLSQPTRRS